MEKRAKESKEKWLSIVNQLSPKRIARRTRRGSSKKVSLAGNGVTTFPDFRSPIPRLSIIMCAQLKVNKENIEDH